MMIKQQQPDGEQGPAANQVNLSVNLPQAAEAAAQAALVIGTVMENRWIIFLDGESPEQAARRTSRLGETVANGMRRCFGQN